MDFAGSLAGPISAIFNSSLREGVIPQIWKSADVIPLPKKMPPKLLEKDLRPISLTPVISKVLEQFMYAWLWDVIKDKVDPGQFGAIKGSCTTYALIQMIHEWLQATDTSRDKNFVHVILLDYAKAFDHVDPNILLRKLQNLDIPDPLLRWIESFLIDRQQRVKIGSSLSEWVKIWGTVPQGTLLGILCFICMINDLQTPNPTIKYVDDTTIYRITNIPHDSSLQLSTNIALDWSQTNNMKINASKTKEMVVSFAKKPPAVPAIIVDGEPIERVCSVTLLGVEITENLSWQAHVERMCKKASSRIFFIAQLRRTSMDSLDIVKVFVTLIRPILEYACQVWHTGLNEQQHNQLESIQERALALAFPSLSYEEACEKAQLPPLRVRREDFCNRLFLAAQDPSHKLFSLIPVPRDITHNQRKATKYPLPKVKTNRFKNSFIPYCLFNFN
jgi:hypothetical protein